MMVEAIIGEHSTESTTDAVQQWKAMPPRDEPSQGLETSLTMQEKAVDSAIMTERVKPVYALPNLLESLGHYEAELSHRPWPKIQIEEIDWMVLVDRLQWQDWSVLSLWWEPRRPNASQVDAYASVKSQTEKQHKNMNTASQTSSADKIDADKIDIVSCPRCLLAVRDNQTGDLVVLAVPISLHGIPSVARIRPCLTLLEQALHHRFALKIADYSVDTCSVQLSPIPIDTSDVTSRIIGPAMAGFEAPMRLRLRGEHFNKSDHNRITTQESEIGIDLGYTRRQIEALLRGRMPAQAVRLVCRITAAAPVAMSWSFVEALETALQVEIPERAVWMRAILAELERIGRHLRYCSGLYAEAGAGADADRWLILREGLLRVSAQAFGHRLLLDMITPGGVTDDLTIDGRSAIREWLVDLAEGMRVLSGYNDDSWKPDGAGLESPMLESHYKPKINAHIAQRLSGLGVIDAPSICIDLTGPDARAAGRSVDARRLYGYGPYGQLDYKIPVLSTGDGLGRLTLRLVEIYESINLLGQLLDKLPEGRICNKQALSPARIQGQIGTEIALKDSGTGSASSDPTDAPEGLAMIEGPDGEIFTALRLDATGRLAACHIRAPSWLLWPLFPDLATKCAPEDLGLLRRSLGLDIPSVDL